MRRTVGKVVDFEFTHKWGLDCFCMQTRGDSGKRGGLVLFESNDGAVELDVGFDGITVWLTKEQMGILFSRDRTVISRHISNIYKEYELEHEGTCVKIARVRTEGNREVTRTEDVYSLDVIISVGYRVKSQRGVEFRRWATDVLRRYITEGHAENLRRPEQLGLVTRVMARIPDELDARQVLDIVRSYTSALDLLDATESHWRSRRSMGERSSTTNIAIANKDCWMLSTQQKCQKCGNIRIDHSKKCGNHLKSHEKKCGNQTLFRQRSHV